LKETAKKVARAEPVRFVVFGAINTAVTYLLYLVLLRIMSYGVAYTVTYVTGVALSYLLNRIFVFRKPARVDHIVTFPVAYLIPYLSGILMLRILIGYAGMDARIAPLAALLVTVPMSFFLLRAVMRGRKPVA
jgi:putative flippase GtrA